MCYSQVYLIIVFIANNLYVRNDHDLFHMNGDFAPSFQFTLRTINKLKYKSRTIYDDYNINNYNNLQNSFGDLIGELESSEN
jgi:hypothetical protein